jgi:hypothetical protein
MPPPKQRPPLQPRSYGLLKIVGNTNATIFRSSQKFEIPPQLMAERERKLARPKRKRRRPCLALDGLEALT